MVPPPCRDLKDGSVGSALVIKGAALHADAAYDAGAQKTRWVHLRIYEG